MSEFRLDNITKVLDPQIQKEDAKLKDMMNTGKEISTVDMVKLQMESNRYYMTIQLESALAKNIKDAFSQIVQKM